MALTSDQLHVYQSTRKWRDFRMLFASKTEALTAYSAAAQRLHQPSTPTHFIEWRHLYDDRETTFLAFLSLLSAPLGIHYSRQNEYRFVTAHVFTKQEWRSVMLGRALGSICYYTCFGLILLCGAGLAYGVIDQLYSGHIDLAMTALSIVSLAGGTALWIAAAKSRSLGLPENLKSIAKDIFDLVSIKAVKSTKLTST